MNTITFLHRKQIVVGFLVLGEKATTDITKTRDARGFEENKRAAQRGGQIANNARTELEQETKKTVVSKDNFLGLTKKKKVETEKIKD